jgi:hypothetical protein
MFLSQGIAGFAIGLAVAGSTAIAGSVNDLYD